MIDNIDKKRVASEVFLIMFDFDWDDERRKEKALNDIEWTLSFIIQSIKLNNKQILFNYYLWMKEIFKTYQLDVKYLDQMFSTIKEHLKRKYNFNIDALIDALPVNENYESITLTNHLFQSEMKKYMEFVLNSNRKKASEYIKTLIEDGVLLEDIYLYVFQESLRHVGDLWLKGEISVAMEHYFTATTQYIMSTLYDNILSEETSDKRVLACAVGSELHEVGIRMVADLFELYGWNSRYLGASVPVKDIVEYAEDFRPHVIAISITMAQHVLDLQNVVKQLKSVPSLKETKIIVGGLPFINNEKLFEEIGADAYSTDALEGIRIANEFI